MAAAKNTVKDGFILATKYTGLICAVYAEFSNHPTLRSVSYGMVIPLGLSLTLIFQFLERRKEENINKNYNTDGNTKQWWKIGFFNFISNLPLLFLIVQSWFYGVYIVGWNGFLDWLNKNVGKEPSTYLTIQWFVFMGLSVQILIWMFYIKDITLNSPDTGANIAKFISNPIVPFFFMIVVLTTSMMNYQHIILKDFIVDG
jgi:hypothetical protein